MKTIIMIGLLAILTFGCQQAQQNLNARKAIEHTLENSYNVVYVAFLASNESYNVYLIKTIENGIYILYIDPKQGNRILHARFLFNCGEVFWE